MSDTNQQVTPVGPAENPLLLLVALLLILLAAPLLETFFVGRLLMQVGTTVVLFYGLFSNRRRRPVLIAGVAIGAAALPLTWFTLFVDNRFMFAFGYVLEGAFFLIMAGFLLVAVMRRHLATIQSIFGAICVYLLLGLAWTMLYSATNHIDGRSFSLGQRAPATALYPDREATAFSHFVYFSFVTMSTLGYGDIVPESSVTRTLAWMQSVTGQFYLAVLVARLVTEIPRRGPESGLVRGEA